jgi:hypothetical protein
MFDEKKWRVALGTHVHEKLEYDLTRFRVGNQLLVEQLNQPCVQLVIGVLGQLDCLHDLVDKTQQTGAAFVRNDRRARRWLQMRFDTLTTIEYELCVQLRSTCRVFHLSRAIAKLIVLTLVFDQLVEFVRQSALDKCPNGRAKLNEPLRFAEELRLKALTHVGRVHTRSVRSLGAIDALTKTSPQLAHHDEQLIVVERFRIVHVLVLEQTLHLFVQVLLHKVDKLLVDHELDNVAQESRVVKEFARLEQAFVRRAKLKLNHFEQTAERNARYVLELNVGKGEIAQYVLTKVGSKLLLLLLLSILRCC